MKEFELNLSGSAQNGEPEVAEPEVSEQNNAVSAEGNPEDAEAKDTDTDNGDGTGEGNGDDGPLDNTDDYIEISLSDGVRALNRDEAVHYAQRGVELEGVYNKLDYLAAAAGKTVDEYLKSQFDIREANYRQEIESRVTDKEIVEQMMGVYRSREKEQYEKAILGRKQAEDTARQTRESQIAEDFLKLQKEFPEVKDFKSLPNEVKQEAAKGGNILSAYLLYKHREGQAMKKAEESANAAAAASAGSMQSTADVSEESFSDFKKALFGN